MVSQLHVTQLPHRGEELNENQGNPQPISSDRHVESL